ncbi:zinc ribbon domain-containing protein [Streptomyces sp. TBY4]|uniref:zinc ribbon domain-containing protein n=1 Tax=Streptomyces sp. TBY4 TaxID=2962030 RepID=UPI0020B82595|nr:zinc ribbon domain-containing protein [Streptomyces sp. TBY4]MCP3753850.1 zinc ribbon domain-containing protein [Streptomyces sp. TBY4]
MIAFRGFDTVSGEVLKVAALVERVGWLTVLVETMAGGVVGGHWSRAELAVLASGVSRAGERLPSNAWMAMRTLGWTAVVPAGLYVPDRVRRVAEEQAGRVLRSAEWRAALVDAVLETWPAAGDPMKRSVEEWAALRAACPQGAAVPASVFRSRTRQVLRFLAVHRHLPADLCELEAAPGGGRQVALAAADKQLATLARCEDDPARYAVLTVRLPVRPDPRTRGDWHPVRIRIRLPPTIDAAAALHAPTLRPLGGRLRLDVAHTTAVPKTRRDGHTRAVAFDYGLNTLLTGGTLTLTGGTQPTVLTDGQPAFLRTNGALAKADRLRVHAEHLWTKAAHLELLLGGQRARGLHPDPAIVTKLAGLRTEHSRVSGRRRRLNAEISKAAARFMVDHARAAQASVICLEDLRDMESRGKGRTLNTRLSSSVRGQIVADVRHQAARHGIAVVIVPARGTSRFCPRCLTAFRHHAAPDSTRPGWKWATCPHPDCGYSADRDVAAWQRIGARGLQHQHLTVLDRANGTYVIRRTVQDLDQPVQHTKPTHPDPFEAGPDERPPCAQAATQGPRPTRSTISSRTGQWSRWKASGGAAAPVTHPPPPAARPAAGTAHDEHPHTAPTARGQTRRRLPPAHPRHPAHTAAATAKPETFSPKAEHSAPVGKT